VNWRVRIALLVPAESAQGEWINRRDAIVQAYLQAKIKQAVLVDPLQLRLSYLDSAYAMHAIRQTHIAVHNHFDRAAWRTCGFCKSLRNK
jgi:hypothetical protein